MLFLGGAILFTGCATYHPRPLPDPAATGMLTVLGLGVNNGIVLVDFANHRIGQGVLPAAALVEAARIRLRPILATTLTTIAGLLPTAVLRSKAADA